jgi:hypothetical protein
LPNPISSADCATSPSSRSPNATRRSERCCANERAPDASPRHQPAKPQTRREPRPFRFCRLACRERRHYRSRTGAIKRLEAEGTGDEIYSESKTENSSSPTVMFQAKRLRWTWAEPLAAPASNIIRNQKTPSRRHAHRSRHSGLGRFTAAQGPLAPAPEMEYFVAHIQPHGSPHLNSASATVPAVGRRNPIIDTGCSDHPRGFSRSSIYGRSSEISRRRRTRLRQQAHFLLRLSMKATSI